MQSLVPLVSAEYRPEKQAVHTADVVAAATALYEPAAHAVHAGPAVEIAPPALYEPAGHAAQPPAPACLPYPGVQLRAAMATSSTVSTRGVVTDDKTHKQSAGWLSVPGGMAARVTK